MLIALSFMAVAARAQGYNPAAEFTPDFGEGIAKGRPACELPTIAKVADARVEQLPLGAGTIELTADFSAEPQKRPNSNTWNATDKTSFSVLVDSFPMGGLASSGGGGGGVHFEHSPGCVVSISGHHAMVDRVRILMKSDTIYLAIIPVFAKLSGIVNATIQAHTAERRDELLARFAAASLTK